jgi:1-acyl-sn-glycerol-3-phosphate acyltransferase
VDDWKLEPARDLGLPPLERHRSARRESGLPESVLRLGWCCLLRGVFRTWNRLEVRGREHVPAEPPFVLVANHASHLDALVLASVLPLRLRDRIFPLAAHDVFFEKQAVAAFAASVLNALPVRRRASRFGLAEFRERLAGEGCVYLLFPEGGRSRDGSMKPFKSGVGQLVAGVPVPVVPCHLDGTLAALPPGQWLLRPARLTLRVGRPLTFAETPNERSGWDRIASQLEAAVKELVLAQPLVSSRG